MSESSTALRNQAGQTVDELKALIREAEAALSNVGTQASDELEGLRKRLRSAFEESKNTLGEAANLAREQMARADKAVRANPYIMLGIVAAGSFLVGYLVSRCNRSS